MACISYFGGKSSSVFKELINSRIPKSGIKTYVEPFSGSFATYLDDESLKFDTVIYNDKNRHQVNLYKCCSEPQKFLPILEKLKQTLLSTDLTDKEEKRVFYRSLYKKYVENDSTFRKKKFTFQDFQLKSQKGFCDRSKLGHRFGNPKMILKSFQK